jgi:hypothetical protein
MQENNIKIELKQKGLSGGDWIDLAEERNQRLLSSKKGQPSLLKCVLKPSSSLSYSNSRLID